MRSPTYPDEPLYLSPANRKNQTLGKMLDISPNSPFIIDSQSQNFPNFHHTFRLKPAIIPRSPSNKISYSHRPSSNNTPKMSPINSPMQSPTNSARRVITWKDSLVSSSIFDPKNLHIRRKLTIN